jgi:hypothetical protein
MLEYCTYKPKIDEISELIMAKKSPRRNVVDVLYNDAEKKRLEKA